MNYREMKQEYLNGWHTWNVRSVLSHVHMPDGFASILRSRNTAVGII